MIGWGQTLKAVEETFSSTHKMTIKELIRGYRVGG